MAPLVPPTSVHTVLQAYSQQACSMQGRAEREMTLANHQPLLRPFFFRVVPLGDGELPGVWKW